MDVFVYGTLTAPDRVAAVVDSYAFVGPARLRGLHLVEGRYPTLAPGGEAAGRLLRTDEVDRLDAYEGVDDGLYVRVAVPRTDGGSAAVYVGDPDRLDAAVDWPGSGPFPDRVRAFLARSDVAVDPLDDG
jgi:gamma-glutamylcyclotransferase (GGCT)/AIG2-like uncharacterized protein YtfP